ncbi:short-chain dehydrogenase [Xylariales sp. PMI_506]|nr:short-chain dehydrogenase [Xylariales sp. PMI_506]
MTRISNFSQAFPPTPTWTDKDVPDLTGKVYIVTGSNIGLGKDLVGILYAKNATVWAAARNEAKNTEAIRSIKEAHPQSAGAIEPLHLDLSDLRTIRASAEAFLARSSRLDVLFNNAGVMVPPQGSVTPQGYELQLGTNNLGPFLFTKLLTPILAETARAQPAPGGSVRVVWVSSSMAELFSPPGGVELDNLNYEKRDNTVSMRLFGQKYGISKAGNYYHNTEYARRHREDGIVSVALNPGNLATGLDRYLTGFGALFRRLTTYPSINGAYTELFGAFSPEISLENTGAWVAPWGRFSDIREDLMLGAKSEAEGGTGIARQFWEWTEEQVKPYI